VEFPSKLRGSLTGTIFFAEEKLKCYNNI